MPMARRFSGIEDNAPRVHAAHSLACRGAPLQASRAIECLPFSCDVDVIDACDESMEAMRLRGSCWNPPLR
ncbi:MAG: hypothetical protein QGG74_04580 [Phycisphaerales bacterium]|nr:hypothetical protein [Phycisphaerales bacterium]